MSNRGIGFRIAALAVAISVTGQSAFAQKARIEWPAQAQLIVSPAPMPVPALRYRLLPPVVDQTPGNAAPIYQAAFTAGADVNFETVEKFLTAPFDQFPKDEATAYVERFADALRKLDAASRRSFCDWEDPVREEGLRLSLAYVRNGRLLGRLLGLRIRQELHERRFNDALRSLQTGFALARAYSTQGLFLHIMASSDPDGIEKVLFDRLREWTELRDSPNLYWALANFPRPLHDSRHALDVEDAALYFTFPGLGHPEILTGQQAEELMEQIWQLIGGQPDAASARKAVNDYVKRILPQAREFLARGGRDREQVAAFPDATAALCFLVDEYRREVDELYKWAGMPYGQAAKCLANSFDRFPGTRSNNPLFRLVPRTHSQLLVMAIRDREAALLQCVEALRGFAANNDGAFPLSLDTLAPETPVPIDPVLNAPFEYRVDEGTAVLKAASPMSSFPGSAREYRISIRR